MTGDLNAAKREALREFSETCTALVERIRGVSAQVETELATVTTRTDSLLKGERKLRRGMRVLYVLTALVVAAAIGLTVVAANLSDSQHELKRSDDIQTNQALCPLYTLLINSDTPQSKEQAAKNGADTRVREKQFETIRESYRALHCLPMLTPEGKAPTPEDPSSPMGG
jgi:hypothetical protein